MTTTSKNSYVRDREGAFWKVITVIDSSVNRYQLTACHRLIRNFRKVYLDNAPDKDNAESASRLTITLHEHLRERIKKFL